MFYVVSVFFIEVSLSRGRSRYQNLRWALANQGGIASYDSRPYGMRVYFFAKKMF